MKAVLILISILLIFSCGSSDPEVTTKVPDAIFINQEGYLPTTEKYFITNIEDTAFSIIDTNGNDVFTGTVELETENDASTGLKLFIGDFSNLQIEGSYKVKLENGTESYSFEIDNDVYNDTAKKSIKSFYFQRCGHNLDSSLAGAFAHPACHTNDNTFHTTVPASAIRNTNGGWHDAGDYGKYITPGAVALAKMTIMYEQFPDKFVFDNNGIPESGNGVNDFLDEIKIELDWMLKMQNVTPDHDYEGAVNYMVNTKGYSSGMPQNDSATRYIYDYSSVATADFAAIMAQAARLFSTGTASTVYPTASATYLTAAEKAWTFLEANSGLVPSGGFVRPGDTLTGGYCQSADENDSDDRMWAAVELWITTGEDKYHTAAINLGLSSTNLDIGTWPNTYGFARLQYLLADLPTSNASIKTQIISGLTNFNANIRNNIDNHGFRDSMTEYYWGGTGGLMQHAQLLLLEGKLVPGIMNTNEKYALRLLNYLLGTNPFNMSFVTKTGTAYPKNIHHAQLVADNTSDIFPGLVPGGPNETAYIYGDPLPQGTPGGLCYVDIYESYATNENCILYTAPLVGTAFYFSTAAK